MKQLDFFKETYKYIGKIEYAMIIEEGL